MTGSAGPDPCWLIRRRGDHRDLLCQSGLLRHRRCRRRCGDLRRRAVVGSRSGGRFERPGGGRRASSTGLCFAIDVQSDEVFRYLDGRWGISADLDLSTPQGGSEPNTLAAISCGSASFCVALDDFGEAFDLRREVVGASTPFTPLRTARTRRPRARPDWSACSSTTTTTPSSTNTAAGERRITSRQRSTMLVGVSCARAGTLRRFRRAGRLLHRPEHEEWLTGGRTSPVASAGELWQHPEPRPHRRTPRPAGPVRGRTVGRGTIGGGGPRMCRHRRGGWCHHGCPGPWPVRRRGTPPGPPGGLGVLLGPAHAKSVSFLVLLVPRHTRRVSPHGPTRLGALVRWSPGQRWATISGAPRDVDRSFHLSIDDYRTPAGQVVFAADHPAAVPDRRLW